MVTLKCKQRMQRINSYFDPLTADVLHIR